VIVRIEAFRALERLLACEIPELDGHICTGQSPAGEIQEYPSLTIDPGRLTYEPHQALEVAKLPGARAIYNVGSHDGPVSLRLVATSVGERWTLEQKVLDVFLSQLDEEGFGRPGVLVVPVSGCSNLSRQVATFELDEDEWNDARAFDRRYESVITLRASLPALATRCGVYTIHDLRLGLTADMATAFTPSTMVPPAVEVVRVEEDGTMTPIP
jgi:hypothetical protein